jgi:hypothetical protein
MLYCGDVEKKLVETHFIARRFGAYTRTDPSGTEFFSGSPQDCKTGGVAILSIFVNG